jgi:hypothetical protein
VCVILTENKTDILEFNFLFYVIAYNFNMVNGLFKIRNTSKVHNNDQIVMIFQFNKLVYIYVQNEFVIGQVVMELLNRRRAVAMMNKTVRLNKLIHA